MTPPHIPVTARRLNCSTVFKDFQCKEKTLIQSKSNRKTAIVTTSPRRGSLQLWQFLIALLEDPNNCAAITWTGRGMEFKLIEPEEVSTEHSALASQPLKWRNRKNVPMKDFNILVLTEITCI